MDILQPLSPAAAGCGELGSEILVAILYHISVLYNMFFKLEDSFKIKTKTLIITGALKQVVSPEIWNTCSS